MHVVEATLYYSAGLMPVLMGGLHPVVALAWIIDCAVGAWLGHDGFQVFISFRLLYLKNAVHFAITYIDSKVVH